MTRHVCVRLPKRMVADIDKRARAGGVSRTAVILDSLAFVFGSVVAKKNGRGRSTARRG